MLTFKRGDHYLTLNFNYGGSSKLAVIRNQA